MSNVGIRAQQKEKTRRALVDAAFNQLSAEKSFSNLSLREVARQPRFTATSKIWTNWAWQWWMNQA